MCLTVNSFRFLLLLLALGLPACQSAQPQPLAAPTPLPQADRIQVYLNQSETSSYTDPYRQQTRAGDDLEQVIMTAIAAAQSTIDIAVQEFRLPHIAAALAERRQAGIKIRLILENTYAQPYSRYIPAQVAQLPAREQARYEEALRLIDLDGDGQLSQTEIEQRDALIMSDRAQIPRLDDTADGSAGSNLMHHKFMVVDRKTVISTSANWTMSDMHGDFKTEQSRGNANNLLKIDSPELAALFTKEFNIMWGDGPGNKPDSRFGTKKTHRPASLVKIDSTLLQVQFSPTAKAIPWQQSSNGLIGRTLRKAKQTVDMALFVFSDQKLVNLLEPVHQTGVEIRALIEPSFAFRSYSEALDMLGVTLTDDCKLEADNRPWQQPISTVGVPRMPPGDLLHHKFGVVDGQIVITGSHNWTEAANTGNDETVLVIYNLVVAAHYQREFERLYTNAIIGLPSAIRKKANRQLRECPQISTRPTKEPARQLASARGIITSGLLTHSAQKDAEKQRSRSAKVGVKLAQVNLNTATQKELEALPGIGAKLALRIIVARQSKPFQSLSDLAQVPGIKQNLVSRLAKQVTW